MLRRPVFLLALMAPLCGSAQESAAPLLPVQSVQPESGAVNGGAGQVGLPVEADVAPAPVKPATTAELEAVLPLFSEKADVFSQQDGAILYHATCAACHMPDGKGAAGAGAYPPLAGNPKTISPYYVATVLLTGYHGMPRFGNTMDDAQIANVTNYVRSHFGNSFEGTITAEEVRLLRGE